MKKILNYVLVLFGAVIISVVSVNMCSANDVNDRAKHTLPENLHCAIVEVTPPILPEGDKGTIAVICPADTNYDPGECSITTDEKHGFDDPVRYIILECPADIIYNVRGGYHE